MNKYKSKAELTVPRMQYMYIQKWQKKFIINYSVWCFDVGGSAQYGYIISKMFWCYVCRNYLNYVIEELQDPVK